MNRDEALSRLHEELGTWPKPSTLRADVPDVPRWDWKVAGDLVSLVDQDSGDVITEDHWEEAENCWPERRMDAVGQNGGDGLHYAEDSDGESALSQALSMPSKYHVRLKGVRRV